MRTLLIVDRPEHWPIQIPMVEVVTARRYLSEPEFRDLRGAVVFNLCRSYSYQKMGYYVSLLAEARGHRPQPNVTTLQEFRHRGVTRIASDEIATLVERSFRRLRSDTFELSIYFGRPLTKAHLPLARALFEQFPAPLLRARFARGSGKAWELRHLSPIAAEGIPPHHRDFVVEAAGHYFSGRRNARRRKRPPRYYLAILVDPEEEEPPSDPRALDRFERAARELQIGTELITKKDRARLAEFDGLFIRTTTAVNHYTYRFAEQATADGLVVIDDPLSIIRCSNKVYLLELLTRRGIPQPRSMLLYGDAPRPDLDLLGYPCVLKEPDGSYSRGVMKVESPEQAEAALDRLFSRSAIVLAQEYVPTGFDWRVGVLDGQPLYVCRYFMARGHWQIMHHEATKPTSYGRVETIPVEEAPPAVVRLALKAAGVVGDGLYGVDIKESGRRRFVIEVNDNPTIETGMEDQVLKRELYRRVMEVFLRRMAERRNGEDAGS